MRSNKDINEMTMEELREEVARKEEVIRSCLDSITNKNNTISGLSYEVNCLNKTIKQLKDEYKNLWNDIVIGNLQDTNQIAAEEIESLSSVLEYYANLKNYLPIEDSNDGRWDGCYPIMLDGGKRARKRLEKVSGMRAFSISKTLTEKVTAQREEINRLTRHD